MWRDYAYLALREEPSHGVQIVDVANPDSPVHAGYLRPAGDYGYVFAVVADDGKLYLAAYGAGLQIYGIIIDRDADGINGEWEYAQYGDTGRGRLTDTDTDGIFDLGEYEAGTDPKDSDTDDDGMPDGWEVQMGFNPTHADGADDADGDLLTNAGEYENQTDPFDSDTDGDGQNDYEEVVITGMNPLDADSLLKLESLTLAPGGFELKWLSATGRVYDLLSSTNLMEGFQPLQSDLPAGTGGFTVVTNVPGQSPIFYKVRVRLP